MFLAKAIQLALHSLIAPSHFLQDDNSPRLIIGNRLCPPPSPALSQSTLANPSSKYPKSTALTLDTLASTSVFCTILSCLDTRGPATDPRLPRALLLDCKFDDAACWLLAARARRPVSGGIEGAGLGVCDVDVDDVGGARLPRRMSFRFGIEDADMLAIWPREERRLSSRALFMG